VREGGDGEVREKPRWEERSAVERAGEGEGEGRGSRGSFTWLVTLSIGTYAVSVLGAVAETAGERLERARISAGFGARRCLLSLLARVPSFARGIH
jgi:hypothetical protein